MNVWVDHLMNTDIASAGQLLESLMTGASSTQTRFDRMTLLRTIIGIDIGYTVHDAGEGSQRVECGIGITSQEAFAAGSVPDPETESDFPTKPWVWRARYRIFGFAADQPTIFTRRVDLDIRAKRVLDNGEPFLVVDNSAIEGVSSSVRLVGLIRTLWSVN